MQSVDYINFPICQSMYREGILDSLSVEVVYVKDAPVPYGIHVCDFIVLGIWLYLYRDRYRELYSGRQGYYSGGHSGCRSGPVTSMNYLVVTLQLDLLVERC
jgi:hypothetical protein